jgi:hypothetical protein
MYNFTGIPDFELSKETCFVCGRQADTKEHLFPKWLQHKYNLWDQQIIIPNKSSIAYRQLTVPCCRKCNNEVFSGLENKISTNTETEADIWRWANKVHFALTLEDKILEWDRRNPGYKIGDIVSQTDPLELSRHFLHCVSGDFKTDPDPFGSVFRFIFTSEQNYNFIHIIKSSSICISLGNRGYIVFVRDGQFVKNSFSFINDLNSIHNKNVVTMYDMLFFYAKSVEYIERFVFTIPILVTKGQIVKLGDATIRRKNPPNKVLLSELCKWMGFTWVDSDANLK